MTAQPIALAPSSEPVDKPILVGVLGPLQILGEATPTAGMMRRTLALLALRAGRYVPSRDFYREFWPRPPAKPAQCLQTYVMFLRREFRMPIETGHYGYTLAVDPFEIDAHRFATFIGRARARFEDGDLLGAQDTLRAADSLWRGSALVDMEHGPLLAHLAAEVDDRRAGALELGWEIDLRLGKHREIVDSLAAAVRSNPGREDTAATLMLALYRSNRRADALRVFQEVRTALVEGFGLEPCPALRRLQGQILAGDPVLDLEAM